MSLKLWVLKFPKIREKVFYNCCIGGWTKLKNGYIFEPYVPQAFFCPWSWNFFYGNAVFLGHPSLQSFPFSHAEYSSLNLNPTFFSTWYEREGKTLFCLPWTLPNLPNFLPFPLIPSISLPHTFQFYILPTW